MYNHANQSKLVNLSCMSIDYANYPHSTTIHPDHQRMQSNMPPNTYSTNHGNSTANQSLNLMDDEQPDLPPTKVPTCTH